MTKSRSMSLRLVAAAGSLALAASAFAAPAVVAADTPEQTINEFAIAFEAKDIDALPSFFCAEQADTLGGIGLAQLLGQFPAFLDVDMLLDGVVVDIELDSVIVSSQTEAEATVDLVGTMESEIDMVALEPLIVTLLGLFGEEATPEAIQDAKDDLAATIPPAQVTDISGEVILTRDETGGWVICSPLPGSEVIEELTS